MKLGSTSVLLATIYELIQVHTSIPIPTIIRKLQRLKKALLQNKVITPQMATYILSATQNYRVPVFYLLIKLHKPQLCGRPITSSVNWILHPLSKVLDHILQPFLRRTKSYLADSSALLRTLHTAEFQSEVVLVTADVASLYPSIPPEGIDIVMQFLYTSPLFGDMVKPPFLREALDLVLLNNYVSFKQNIFLQKSGTAMGTPVAVCYASLFLAALEDSITSLPLLYQRFIDDIFMVCNPEDVDNIKTHLQEMHPAITLTFESSVSSIDFLDLTIFKGELFKSTSHLDTRLYAKPFNKFLYIPWHSFHSKLQKRSFILGLLTTFIRVSSAEMSFLKSRKLFYLRLRARGYPTSFLLPLFESIKYSTSLRDKQMLILHSPAK
jgi:hypothetical protein